MARRSALECTWIGCPMTSQRSMHRRTVVVVVAVAAAAAATAWPMRTSLISSRVFSTASAL